MNTNYSIINRKMISPANRIDSEFYSKNFIEQENSISMSDFKLFSDLCSESDEKVNPTKEADKYFECCQSAKWDTFKTEHFGMIRRH